MPTFPLVPHRTRSLVTTAPSRVPTRQRSSSNGLRNMVSHPLLVQRLFTDCFAGDIFYLEILGRKIVIVNSYEIANELMDKRSANYSDRPVFPLFMK